MRTGDLVFTQIGRSDNVISSVTEGYRGARVNHIGVALETRFGVRVLEAYYPEVRVTNIDVHVKRSQDHRGNPRYMLGRLKDAHHHLIPDAINYGISQREIPYDRLYLTDSELVVDMFKSANNEPPRVLRRLQALREWSHEEDRQDEEVFPRGP